MTWIISNSSEGRECSGSIELEEPLYCPAFVEVFSYWNSRTLQLHVIRSGMADDQTQKNPNNVFLFRLAILNCFKRIAESVRWAYSSFE